MRDTGTKTLVPPGGKKKGGKSPLHLRRRGDPLSPWRGRALFEEIPKGTASLTK